MDATEPSADSLQERIASRLATMSRAERRVAEYLRNHPHKAVFATAEEIGTASGTSDATVVRTAKSLGYSGLLELKYIIGQQVMSAINPYDRMRDRIEEVGHEPSSLVDHVFREADERLAQTRQLLSDDDLAAAVDVLAGARRILCFGIGPSEGVANYFALRLTRLGRHATGTGATGFRLADDLLLLQPSDAVVLISPARLLNEHDVILAHVADVGARAILLTDSLGPLLGDRVDVVLRAVHSTSNFTGEAVTSLIVVDLLALSLAARDEAGTTSGSELLTRLRSQLIDSDSRDYVSRARRRGR